MNSGKPEKSEPKDKPAKDEMTRDEGKKEEATAKAAEAKSSAAPKLREPRKGLLPWGIVVGVILAALIVWLVARGGGEDSSSEPVSAGAAPQLVSAEQLREASARGDTPIYWAGEMEGTEIELSALPTGTQVRYLPEGSEAGASISKTLTIGTYPLQDPSASLQGYAQRPDAIVKTAADGREVISSTENPTSVYFVSPDNSVQIEVYDPSAQEAMSLALSAEVQPAD
ncbi:MAG TPA: hypothetical protein VF176_03155 [Solirubrobacterales bacterium]